MAEQMEKEVVISLTFKEAALDVKTDAEFKSLVDLTVADFAKRINDARSAFKASKDGIVQGVPTLQEKGVEVSLKWTF